MEDLILIKLYRLYCCPDNKVYGAKMGPTWGRQEPGGPHVGPMNLAIWVGPTLILYALNHHGMTYDKKFMLTEFDMKCSKHALQNTFK